MFLSGRTGLRQRFSWVPQVMLVAFLVKAAVFGLLASQAGANLAYDGALVICTAQGAKVVADVDGSGDEPDSKAGHHHDCALMCAGQPLILSDRLTVRISTFTDLIFWPRLARRLPPVRAGPQLTIRGPPVFA